MDRFKTAVADGSAPNGRFYAGDFNMLQDLVAALTDFAQVISTGELRIGDSGIAIVKYGAGEARLTSRLRIDAILRALGGLYLGSFNDAAIAAVPAADRPFGIIIENSTRGRFEWNVGTGASPVWYPIACDVNGNLVMPPGGTIIIDGEPIQNLISPYPTEIALASWPPGSPANKEEHYLRIDATTLWWVRYDTDTSDAYKWDVLGPPIYAQRGGATGTGTGFANASDGTFAAVCPRAGVYDVDHGFEALGISDATWAIASVLGGQAYAGTSVEDVPRAGSGRRKIFGAVLSTSQQVVQTYAGVRAGGGTPNYTVDSRYIELQPRRIS